MATYPDNKAYTYAYDTMARPISLTDNQSVTWVNGVQYGLSSELLQIGYAGYSEKTEPKPAVACFKLIVLTLTRDE